jgi:hypothetical protein
MSYIENSPTIKLHFSEADNIFKSIGDVSAEIGVPPHVLRFWESISLFTPYFESLILLIGVYSVFFGIIKGLKHGN